MLASPFDNISSLIPYSRAYGLPVYTVASAEKYTNILTHFNAYVFSLLDRGGMAEGHDIIPALFIDLDLRA